MSDADFDTVRDVIDDYKLLVSLPTDGELPAFAALARIQAEYERLREAVLYRCPECRKGDTQTTTFPNDTTHYHGSPGAWRPCQLNDRARAALGEQP